MLPKFWIAGRCLTMTFCRAMRTAPARQRHRRDHRQELGRQPDGERDGEQQRLERPADAARGSTTMMNSTRKKTVRRMRTPKRRRPRSNSVSGARAPAARRCRRTPCARPVARHDRRRRAADDGRAERRRVAPTSFSAGIDSPVSAASCTCRSRASTRRASAGTRSPAVRRTTSPGTSSRRGSSRSAPSRSTVAVGATPARKPLDRALRAPASARR